MEILLKACEDSSDFVRLAQVGYGIGDRIVVF